MNHTALKPPNNPLTHNLPSFIPSCLSSPSTFCVPLPSPSQKSPQFHLCASTSQAPTSDTVPKRNRPILKQVRTAQQLRKQGKWKQAQTILQQVQQHAPPDTSLLNELIHLRVAELTHVQPAISPGEMWHQLCELCEHVPAHRTATTWNAILLGLKTCVQPRDARHNQPSEKLELAHVLFRAMLDTGVTPDHFTMSILFQMCAAERNVEFADMFDEEARDTFDFEPNVVSGSALLTVYTKCGHIESMEQIVKQLKQKNVSLNGRSYVSVISAYHKAGMHVKVMQTFREAIQSADVQPHMFLFTGALASCWRAKDSPNARFVFESMLEMLVEPTEDILASLFQIATRSGDVRLGICVLLDWAPRFGLFQVKVDHFVQLVTCCKKSLASVESTESCLKEIVGRMEKETELKPNVELLNSLISAFLRIGCYASAQEVLEKDFRTVGLLPDVVTYNTLMHGLGKAKGYEYGLKVLEVMKKRGVKPDQVTYNTLLRLLQDGKQEKLVAKIMEEMERDTELVSDSVQFSWRLKRYADRKDVAGALRLYWEAVRTNSDRIDSVTHGLLMGILIENNCEREYISVLGWLVWKRLASATVLNVLLEHYRGRKEYEKCKRMFQAMKKKGIAPDEKSYSILIWAYCAQGQIDGAFRVLGEMQDVGLGCADTHAWSTLIEGCGRAGQWERAVEVLQSMRESKSRVKFVPQATTACYNAAIYATGMGGGGWKVALQMYELLKADERQAADVITYSAMASVILEHRSEVTEWGVVEEVCRSLQALTAGEHNWRRDARLPKSQLNKLASKAKRLRWLLAQKT